MIDREWSGMEMTSAEGKLDSQTECRPGCRWWPAVVILALAAARWGHIWFVQDVDRQAKNLHTAILVIATTALLLLWVLLFSRLPRTFRLLILGGVVGIFGFSAALFEIRGVTGDLVPVVEWRWQSPPPLPDEQGEVETGKMGEPGASSQDYPQIYGPDRDGILPGPRLATDWSAQPPEELWRQPIGGGWSGFAVVGEYAVTMEQRGEKELVTCYHLLTGALIWKHADQRTTNRVSPVKVRGRSPRSSMIGCLPSAQRERSTAWNLLMGTGYGRKTSSPRTTVRFPNGE